MFLTNLPTTTWKTECIPQRMQNISSFATWKYHSVALNQIVIAKTDHLLMARILVYTINRYSVVCRIIWAYRVDYIGFSRLQSIGRNDAIRPDDMFPSRNVIKKYNY